MLGFRGLLNLTPLAIPLTRECVTHQIHPSQVRLQKTFQSPRKTKLILYAKDEKNGDQNEVRKDSDVSNNGNGGDDQRPAFFKLRWAELLLDPDPDNVLVVGLTGLLTWASVQVVWQLVVVSLAILIAALKYSFVAALLIFILVALL